MLFPLYRVRNSHPFVILVVWETSQASCQCRARYGVSSLINQPQQRKAETIHRPNCSDDPDLPLLRIEESFDKGEVVNPITLPCMINPAQLPISLSFGRYGRATIFRADSNLEPLRFISDVGHAALTILKYALKMHNLGECARRILPASCHP